MRRGCLAFTLVLAALLPSCGGSTPTGPPPPPPPGIRFQPSVFPAPAGSLTLQLRSSTTEEITLVLTATQVEDLYGWALDLTFDTGILTFVSFEEGDFLREENVEVSSQLVDDSDGRLIVGQTRVGNVAGVDGSGDVLELTFQAETEGSGGIRPENGAAFDSDGNDLPLEILGGSVTVIQ